MMQLHDENLGGDMPKIEVSRIDWRRMLKIGLLTTAATTVVFVGPQLVNRRFEDYDFWSMLTGFYCSAVLGFIVALFRAILDTLRSQHELLSQYAQFLSRMSEERGVNLQRATMLALASLQHVFGDETHRLLQKSERYTPVVGELLGQMIRKRTLAGVTDAQYLGYLSEMLKHCKEFHTVQTDGIDWFKSVQGGEDYLKAVRNAESIDRRERIFVLSDEEVESMIEGKDDQADLTHWYWKAAGIDTQTWAISEKRLREVARASREVIHIEDFVLFDQTVMIKYDREHAVLTLDGYRQDSPEWKVFELLQLDQRLAEGGRVFKKLGLPTSARRRG